MSRKQIFPKAIPACTNESILSQYAQRMPEDDQFEQSLDEQNICITLDQPEVPKGGKKRANSSNSSGSGTKRGKAVSTPKSQGEQWTSVAMTSNNDNSSTDPLVKAAIRLRLQREAFSKTRINPLKCPFRRPTIPSPGIDMANNDIESVKFFAEEFTYRINNMCLRRSSSDRFGHFIHLLKLKEDGGEAVFGNRLGFSYDVLAGVIQALQEIKAEIDAYDN